MVVVPTGVALAIVAAAAAPPWFVVVPLFLLWVSLAGLMAWLAERWPSRAWEHTFYTVDDNGIRIRRGVWWRRIVDVPRSRVQHTDVAQGPLQRRYELGTLVVYTAGSEYARVDLPGLAHDDAIAIRDHLLPRTAGAPAADADAV